MIIESKNISVIVQGAISKEETPKCLKSVRKILPNAEIILSTWEGSDVSALEGLYDVLLLNKDPGAGYYYKTDKEVKYNNLNRQLVSTQEGLKRATKKYAMKVRSDIILTSDKFLKYFDAYPKRDENYKLFEHKILTSTVCTRYAFYDYLTGKTLSEINLTFHVSDWWFFGLKSDLDIYFDIPLAVEPDFSNYYQKEENLNKFNPYSHIEISNLQFSVEQYIATTCFMKHFNDIKIEHAGDLNEENIEQSRRYLINNFIFLEYSESGIYFNKHAMSKYMRFSSTYLDLYNSFRQKYEYNKYCDPEYKIDDFTIFILNDKKFKNDVRHLIMHFQKAIARRGTSSKMFFEILITLYLGLFFIFKHLKFFILLLKTLICNKKGNICCDKY